MDYPQPVYFIGITLPPELNKQLADLKWKLYDKKEGMLAPLLPHVTLLHPPSLLGIMPAELIPRVHDAAIRYLPLTIELSSVGSFGKQVCYLKAESPSLYSLQSQLVKLLPPPAQEAHYKRPYLPHITVAQAYEPKPLDIEAIDKEITAAIKLPLRFTVESVTCFKRILPQEYKSEAIN
jgi:2'-5' RNA ligase